MVETNKVGFLTNLPDIGEEEINAVVDVLKSKRLTLLEGNITEQFEKEFGSWIGTKYAVAVNSGTAAIHAVLMALNIKKGDEVIVPPYTFVATVSPVIMQNAQPIFADIDLKTYNIDIDDVKKKIKKGKTKAIIPVHLFGQSVDMDPLIELCEENDIALIEDACQSHGALYKNKKVGGIGLAGCFSFYPSKNMTTGEGGIITTDDEELYNECRMVRHHGEPSWYHYQRLGYNYRMTEIQAAIGRVQLQKLDKMNDDRIKTANIYNKALSEIDGIDAPHIASYNKSVYNVYAPMLDIEKLNVTREEFMKELNKDVKVSHFIYPHPLYTEPLFDGIYQGEKCPNTEILCKKILKLSLWPFISNEEIQYSINKIRETLKKYVK